MKTEIRRFKVALTSDCPQRCEYCFVDKGERQTLSYDAVCNAVSQFLATPGGVKKLYIYGGEPFTHFDLLKRVILFSRRQAASEEKLLAILVSTGGTSVRREHIEFLNDNDAGLCFSIDGDEKTHERFRVLRGGKGYFRKTLKNINLAFEILGPARMGVSQGVHPQNAKMLFENYRYLVSLGFENTNLEIIQGVFWSPRDKTALWENLRLKRDFLFRRIAEGRFLFPLSVCERLASWGNPAYLMCPLYSSFELFPDGTYSFYPLPFLKGSSERKRASLGSAYSELAPRYKNCRFNEEDVRCRRCTQEYYVISRMSDNEPYMLRARVADGIVDDLARRCGGDAHLAGYVREALKRAAQGFG